MGLAGATVVVAATGALAAPWDPPSVSARVGSDLQADPMATRLQHSRVLPYPSDQVWPAAIRYLRVDRGFTVVDRDRDAGFILFDFPIGPVGSRPEGPTGRGSVELVATVDASGRAAVKLQISTDAGPVHLPHAIAEGLAAKLKAEHGQPAPPPSPQPQPPGQPPQPPQPDDGPWVPDPSPEDEPWAPEPPEG